MMCEVACSECDTNADATDWQCPACGGVLEIQHLPIFDVSLIDTDEWSLWRYRALLPIAERQVTLGEGMTPLTQHTINGMHFYAKLDYLNPTGSYKDRGVAVMMNHLQAQGVNRVVEDSSGNAGSSVAAYAGAAGLQAWIYVPAAAPESKKRQIGMSAKVVEVSATRQAVTDACIADVETGGSVYASHAWSPFFVAGQMTAAWEIWEQMRWRAPDAILCPVGQGGFLLGFARGFAALHAAGLIKRMPRIFAVQAAASDPIVQAWEQGLDEPAPVIPQKTVADGIVIAKPVRGKAVMQALRDSDGGVVRVAETTILPARDVLARNGLFVEPTSATTFAALPDVLAQLAMDNPTVVLALTGHGLKASV